MEHIMWAKCSFLALSQSSCEKRLFASSCMLCLVLLSVRPRGTAQLTPYGFSWISIFGIFTKIRDMFWFWLQLYKNVKLFTWRSKYTHVIGCYDFLCEQRARRENLVVITDHLVW